MTARPSLARVAALDLAGTSVLAQEAETERIAFEPGAASATVEGGFADGLQGGPDLWRIQVSGLLNVRAGPSGEEPPVGRLPAGEVVRNLGCRRNAGLRRCLIGSRGDQPVEGRVVEAFLAGSGPPG